MRPCVRSMIAPPTFASMREHVSRLGDVGFWWPYVAEVLERHELLDAGREPVAGLNATYPTFLCGDIVLKLFGHSRGWRASHAAERGAQRLVATDPEVAAPNLLGEGQLFDDVAAPWPYLITTRMSGVASWRAELSADQWLSLAVELGRQIRRVHALRPSGVATDADWPALNVAAAAEQSSLPPHLIAQIDDYIARLGSFDRVFVHGDLCANHVFVDNGRLTGIIDWGDAMVTDRHYELIQLYRDMFGCDKALLRAFLEASGWPVGKNFPRKALGLALNRQAIGLAQHHTMDVFEPIAARLPLEDIGTLDELAIELFAV
jgi:hygromycin-B 7''-O-kinase